LSLLDFGSVPTVAVFSHFITQQISFRYQELIIRCLLATSRIYNTEEWFPPQVLWLHDTSLNAEDFTDRFFISDQVFQHNKSSCRDITDKMADNDCKHKLNLYYKISSSVVTLHALHLILFETNVVGHVDIV
jgi:hypothetical protein